ITNCPLDTEPTPLASRAVPTEACWSAAMQPIQTVSTGSCVGCEWRFIAISVHFMKIFTEKPVLLPVFAALFGSMLAGQLEAQTFSTLYNFTGGTDGGRPIYGGLLLSSNRLYGTAAHGGDSDLGTVFAVNVDGTGFTTLYSFSGADDGANPHAALTI